MATKTSAGKWRAVVRVHGRKISKNHRTRDLAERWERRMKDGVPEPVRPRAMPTFEEFFAIWKADSGSLEQADSTLKNAETVARKHLFPHFGSLPLDRIGQEECLELRTKLAKTLAPSSANTVMDIPRRLFRVAVKRHYLTASPWEDVRRLKVAEQAFGFWTADERDRFLAVARRLDPPLAELVTVAAFTGLRWGELRALRRRHLDLEGRRVMVAENWRPSVKRAAETKTGRVEFVPMNDAAHAVLVSRALTAPDDLVFAPSLLGGARDRLRSIAKQAGAKPLRFHDLRHTFASCLVMAGVDLASVQKLMRHSSVSMTMRYAHLAPEHLASAANALCRSAVPPVSPQGAAEILRIKKIGT